MDYFLDTNVELGYVFCTDPWNSSAVSVFDSKDKLHYSRNVDNEFQKNFAKFLKEQKQFIFSIADELKYLGLEKINYKEFKSIGISIHLVNDFAENKKESCLKRLGDIFNKNKSDTLKVKNLVRNIKAFGSNFERLIFNRRRDFEEKVILCLDRIENYPEIFDELKDLGIHDEDNHIILDAHDLACKESLTLNFVTSDNNVFKLPQQVSTLNINEFLHLNDF